jgi:hypothetical protein
MPEGKKRGPAVVKEAAAGVAYGLAIYDPYGENDVDVRELLHQRFRVPNCFLDDLVC